MEKLVDTMTALNAIFFENKTVFVEHDVNNLKYNKQFKLGKNIAMMSEIPVTVLIHGKWYIT